MQEHSYDMNTPLEHSSVRRSVGRIDLKTMIGPRALREPLGEVKLMGSVAVAVDGQGGMAPISSGHAERWPAR